MIAERPAPSRLELMVDIGTNVCVCVCVCIQAEAAEEPLSVGRVIVTPVGRQQLHYCWTRNRSRSLYDTAEAYEAFVCEVCACVWGGMQRACGWVACGWVATVRV